MKIEKHTVPTVDYRLEVDGQVVDQSSPENPLAFITGIGMMIPGFEANLLGLTAGDAFDFSVNPEDGYGACDEEALVSLPLDAFKVDGKVKEDLLEPGRVVPMQDANGHRMEGVVLEVSEDAVKMDFNHFLAGKTLHFSGAVKSVRKAEKEELDHGHVHGPDGHQH